MTWLAGIAAAPDVGWIRAGRPAAAASEGLPLGMIATAAVAAALVALGITLLLRLDRARHGPTLRQLGRGLGIGFADRRLLQRVARHGGFTTAGSLLVSRGCFEEAVRVWSGDAARLDAIRRTVFGRSR